jgi:uncharacterized sulfatase
VLFIAVDDLNTRLCCYGHAYMKTPSVDQLASRGVRFDRAYCQYPLCNPSRSSLLTGRRPDTTKVFDNETSFRTALPDAVTLGQHFHNHGYWTARTGKVYHGGIAEAAGWDAVGKDGVPVEEAAKQRVIAKGGRVEEFSTTEGRFWGEWVKLVRERSLPGEPFVWCASEGPEESWPDGRIAMQAVQFIQERPAGKPFFIAAGFRRPHTPFFAPLHYFDLYPVNSIALPSGWEGAKKTVWGKNLTDGQFREIVRAYQACVSFMDAQVGKLLNALEQAKVLDETVVVFWGDNGYHLLEHGMMGKGTLFEESCRVPLIVAAPGKRARGVGCLRLVEFVDIYPTLVELCGLPESEGLEGASFAPLLDDPERSWKKAAFTQYPVRYVARWQEDSPEMPAMGRSVRTERWRYTERGSPETAELYDHESDPAEMKNLAKDPNCATTVAELRGLLRE